MGAAAPFKLHLGNWRLDLHLFLQAAYCFVVVLVLVQNETCWKHPVNQRSVLRSFHQCSKTVPWLKSIAFCSCRESCSHECHVNTVRSVLAPSSDARSPQQRPFISSFCTLSFRPFLHGLLLQTFILRLQTVSDFSLDMFFSVYLFFFRPVLLCVFLFRLFLTSIFSVQILCCAQSCSRPALLSWFVF